MKILTAPNPILFQKAKPVKKIDKKVKALVKEMTKVLTAAKDPEGIGLAANQIGASQRIFIIKLDKKAPLHVFINPQIIQKSRKFKAGDKLMEGCLSIPKIWGSVNRSVWVKLRYQNLAGKIKEEKFEGLFATAIQHEMDHLQGRLFTSRAIKQGKKLYQKTKDAEGKPAFREVNI